MSGALIALVALLLVGVLLIVVIAIALSRRNTEQKRSRAEQLRLKAATQEPSISESREQAADAEALDDAGADQDAVAIDVHRLLRNADKDHERSLWRNFRMPPVLAGLKGSSWFAGGCSFGVKRWFVHRLGRCEESNASSKSC